MFSDLVGSTALSARMDPEDLREVISAYQKCVAETVRSLRRVRREVHGRRRPCLLRLPAGSRGRRRASRARGTGVGRCCGRPEDPRAPADPSWHCDGTGGGRRPDRLRRFSGASHRRRDAKPCSALARCCGAEQCRDCRKYSQPCGQPVRA